MREIVFEAKGWTEEDLARRIASIVIGSDVAFMKTSGFRWQLGASNNWWFDKDRESRPNHYLVAYRYGAGQPERMNALLTVIEWMV